MLATHEDGTQLTREAWLTLRRQSLGASEAAAALGVSPYVTPVELWQRKLGIAPEQPETEAMRWGTLLEPLILAEYQARTGRRVVATQEYRVHPDHPHLTATLDGRCEDGRLVEIKTASAWAREWGAEDTDEVPEPYLVQVAQQMAVTGADTADVVVLIGGQRLRIYNVPRNDRLVDLVVEEGTRFWRCVERRSPPDWGRRTASDLAAVYPGCEGEAAWSLEDAERITGFLDQIEVDKHAAKVIEARIEDNKAHVLKAMGTARTGTLPDGRTVKRFRQEVAAKTVSYEAKAYVRHYFTVLGGKA